MEVQKVFMKLMWIRAGGLLEIFIKLIKIAIIYKLYKIYSVESLKSCDFSYSSLKMMSILIQQRMPVIMLFLELWRAINELYMGKRLVYIVKLWYAMRVINNINFS